MTTQPVIRTLVGPSLTGRSGKAAKLDASQVLALAEHLPRADRALVEAVYEQGRQLTELATLMKDEPRRLGRRLRRLVERLSTPAYAFVALQIEKPGMVTWEPDAWRVARACVLDGLTLRLASHSLKLSMHTVRRHRAMVLGMAAGARAMAVRLHDRSDDRGDDRGYADTGGAEWRGEIDSDAKSEARWPRSA